MNTNDTFDRDDPGRGLSFLPGMLGNYSEVAHQQPELGAEGMYKQFSIHCLGETSQDLIQYARDTTDDFGAKVIALIQGSEILSWAK